MVRIINIDTKTRTIRVSNGKDDLEWFTTDTGSHVPLKKGQSKAEAIKEHFGDKKDKVSGKAIAAAKKEMLARQAKERKALRDSSSRLGESYYKQRVNELIKQQEIEEQDFYEGHGIKAPKAKQQPAKQDKQKLSRDNVKDKSGGANETLDQMLTTGGLTKYERYRMDKMMEHHDIKPEDIIAVLESGEYTPEQVLETIDNYDNEEAILHMLDVAKAKQQPAKKAKETYADTSEIDGAEVFKDGDDYVVLYANGTKTREFSSKTEADKFAKSLSEQPAKQEPEEKAHRIATNLFSAINTSQFTDAQLKSLISSFIYDEADNLDDDGVVTKDELNSEEFKRLKKFVAEKLAD